MGVKRSYQLKDESQPQDIQTLIIEELRESALMKMASQKQTNERHFNKKVEAKIFQVGDYVLRRVFQNMQEVNAGKLSIK